MTNNKITTILNTEQTPPYLGRAPTPIKFYKHDRKTPYITNNNKNHDKLLLTQDKN